MQNLVWRLQKHPIGEAQPSDFRLCQETVEPPRDGEVLIKLAYLSVDPGQRVYFNDTITLHEKSGGSVAAGSPVNGWGVGQVIASESARFPVGSYARDLFGEAGMRQYCTLRASQLIPVDPEVAPLPIYLSALGMPGLTAYFGLLDVGQPKPGETVVISAAAGGVGAAAGQIAKVKGCRVVGIAGGKAKCRYLMDELGFDAAIDRRAENLSKALSANCPDGIDIFFDNVGGPILDECMAQMRMWGRIVFCGAIVAYNATEPLVGPSNYYHILLHQLRWQGFSVPFYERQFDKALAEMKEWYTAGRLRCRVDIDVGIEKFPTTFSKLFRGDNFGKLMIKVDS
jgi:NADPH-dependent curcumin reductase CurA